MTDDEEYPTAEEAEKRFPSCIAGAENIVRGRALRIMTIQGETRLWAVSPFPSIPSFVFISEERHWRPELITRRHLLPKDALLCSNCDSSTHAKCCARCGGLVPNRRRATAFCSSRCEKQQQLEDLLSYEDERGGVD